MVHGTAQHASFRHCMHTYQVQLGIQCLAQVCRSEQPGIKAPTFWWEVSHDKWAINVLWVIKDMACVCQVMWNRRKVLIIWQCHMMSESLCDSSQPSSIFWIHCSFTPDWSVDYNQKLQVLKSDAADDQYSYGVKSKKIFITPEHSRWLTDTSIKPEDTRKLFKRERRIKGVRCRWVHRTSEFSEGKPVNYLTSGCLG